MSLVSGPGRGGSIAVGAASSAPTLAVDKHVEYIKKLDTRKDELEYWLTEQLRLNGVYWGLTALHLLGKPDGLPRDETIRFVLSCQHENGGFGAAPGHDPHMLYTVSAVQILATLDAFSDLDDRPNGGRSRVGHFIANLQDRSTGAFSGDEWGETDTRFLYGAFNALSLLNMLDLVDVELGVNYIKALQNFDGGYGVRPGAESHAAQIWTCVGALTIAGRQDLIDVNRLAAWLSERQLPNGGLNGRPEKLEDVCYSWWVCSSLAMLGKLHWIDKDRLTKFILRCQDSEHGGLADRPGDMVDVFHTVFGIAGLSLMGYHGLVEVDPAYDASHLLTHVSSKGHLSHLHKLQVRSHNDAEAGQQLTTYNQWFATHSVAQLLSERMQQKEGIQARKRAQIKRRATTPKQEPHLKVDPDLDPYLATTIDELQHDSSTSQLQRNPSQHMSYPDISGSFQTPVKYSRSNHTQATIISPLWNASYEDVNDNTPQDVHTGTGTSLEMGRLKGTIWPGMDLFDSADLETQRKRNQKKDVSILKKMEAMSELVEPMETVCSPGGTMKKRRHMDEIEDDSPVEGESPLMKKPSKRKRKPLTNLPANIPHSKISKAGSKRLSESTRCGLVTQQRIAPGERKERMARPAPIVERSRVGISTNQLLKQQHFTIFKHKSPITGTASTGSSKSLNSSFLEYGASFAKADCVASSPTLQLESLPRESHVYDPFKEYRSMHLESYGYAESFITQKENINPLHRRNGAVVGGSNSVGISQDYSSDFDYDFGPLTDVYAYNRNPLIQRP